MFSIHGVVDLADNQADIDALWTVTFAEVPCPRVAFGGDIAQLDSAVFFINSNLLYVTRVTFVCGSFIKYLIQFTGAQCT